MGVGRKEKFRLDLGKGGEWGGGSSCKSLTSGIREEKITPSNPDRRSRGDFSSSETAGSKNGEKRVREKIKEAQGITRAAWL